MRGCLFGVSLSVVVVTIAGYLNASQQAREIRSLQKTVHALRQYTASEFAETRQAAISAGHELNKKLQCQSEELAVAQAKLRSSAESLRTVESKLRKLRNDYQVDLEIVEHELSSVSGDVQAHVHDVVAITGGLELRMSRVEGQIEPLRQELIAVETDLADRIDDEHIARMQLADRCSAALNAEGKILGSYYNTFRALAESRKVRAEVEQELAAEAELEASLLGRLADHAYQQLARIHPQPAEATEAESSSPRVAQAPGPVAPRAAVAEPGEPQLIDAASGRSPDEPAAE